MKNFFFLKISIFISMLIFSFALQAKEQLTTAELVAQKMGVTQSVDALIKITLNNLKTEFDVKQKAEYVRHLKAHYYYMLTPVFVNAIKMTLTESEMKQLLENPSAANEQPLRSKLEKASNLVNQNIDSKAIGRMVTFVTAHHLCIKNPPKEGCPKTEYSIYPKA